VWVRVQLAVGGGGGGSFAWLLEEPALELDELEGLCIRKMKAIVIMNIMNMKNMPWFEGTFAFGVTVKPKASASVSKHCAPVQTECRSSESRTSSTPGRCAAF